MSKKSYESAAESLREQGKSAYFKRKFKTAFAYFEKAAELGDAEAQCRLGEFYDDFGYGFPVDFKKARELYEKSYAQGFMRAGAQLSTLYEDNLAGMRDKKKAEALLDAVCKSDDSIAKFFKALRMLDTESGQSLLREVETDAEFVREFGRLSPLADFVAQDKLPPKERSAALKKLVKNLREQAKHVVSDSAFYFVCGMLLNGEDDDAAEVFLRKSAENGTAEFKAECAYFLWLHGKKGAGTLALESLEQARSIKGMITLGACYLDGSEMPQKEEEAEYWLKNAIKESDPESDKSEIALAEYWLGRLELEMRGNPDLAENYFRSAAEKENEYAAVFLCKLLFSRENPEAFARAEKLADAGAWQGVSVLASCYRDGLGVKKDYSKFLELARRLDEGEISDGTYMLATAYRSGLGVPADIEKAIEIFKRAEKLGDRDAASQIADIYFHSTPADSRAFKWAKKGVEYKDDNAMLILACCYRDGIGTRKNEEKELEWNLQAAEHGNAVGAFNAGLIFYIRDEFRRARELLTFAYENECSPAAAILSKCEFEDGDGDKDAAKKWAEIAIKNEDPAGYPVLGACYLHGVGGVKRDRKRAVELWKKGACLGDKHCARLLEDENETVPAPLTEKQETPQESEPQNAPESADAAGTQIFCVHCGTGNPGFAKFCCVCGKKLEQG